MAYNTEHITKLAGLKALAEKIKNDYATTESVEALEKKVDDIVAEGGEPNVIETVKVNGVALEVENKAVDVTVPTKVSELENDEKYQTEDEVTEAIDTAVSESGHASFKVVDEVPDPSEAESNVMYLVMNEDTGYYDIWVLIDGEMVRIDDTSIDLNDYVTQEELEAALEEALEEYYTKEEIDEEFDEYIPISDIATDEEVDEMLTEVFGE